MIPPNLTVAQTGSYVCYALPLYLVAASLLVLGITVSTSISVLIIPNPRDSNLPFALLIVARILNW